jgi:hypothetical protein
MLQEKVFPDLRTMTFIDRPRTDIFDDPTLPDGKGVGFFPSVLKRSPHLWDEIGEALWSELLRGRDPGKPVLISDEGFGRNASKPDVLTAHLRRIRDIALSKGFSRFRVIALVRRQDHWFASHYAQISDRRPDASQSDFEREVERLTSPSAGFYGFGTLLRYDQLHAALSNELGQDDLYLRPFEELRYQPERFWDGLSRFLGEELSPPSSDSRRNERTAGCDRWFLRPPRVTSARTLVRRSVLHRRRTVELTPRLAGLFGRAFGPSNEAFSALSGIDVKALGYPLADAASSVTVAQPPSQSRPSARTSS